MNNAITFSCKNGTFSIDSLREFRDYSTPNSPKQINIKVTDQSVSMDEIESILLDSSSPIDKFDIINPNTNTTTSFENYELTNISRNIFGKTADIDISLAKGN